jgi:hypothetical protein
MKIRPRCRETFSYLREFDSRLIKTTPSDCCRVPVFMISETGYSFGVARLERLADR